MVYIIVGLGPGGLDSRVPQKRKDSMFFVGGSDRISHFSGAFWLSESLVSGIIRQFQG